MDYKKLISNRKSVRDYKKTSLKASDVEALLAYAKECKRLIKDLNVEVLIMGNEVYDKLYGKAGYQGFMINSPNYAVILSEKKSEYIKNAGYVGEELILKAASMDIDSCWITFGDSEMVKNELGLSSDKEVVGLIALGYEETKSKIVNAPKVGENESKARIDKISELSERFSVEDIVFLNKFGQKADVEELQNRALLDAFHYARLAPSALNRQPWRFILDDDIVVLAVRNDEFVHTYAEDIDAGIVMLYFEAIVDMTLTDISWVLEAPEKDYGIPDDYVVIAYCRI